MNQKKTLTEIIEDIKDLDDVKKDISNIEIAQRSGDLFLICQVAQKIYDSYKWMALAIAGEQPQSKMVHKNSMTAEDYLYALGWQHDVLKKYQSGQLIKCGDKLIKFVDASIKK